MGRHVQIVDRRFGTASLRTLLRRHDTLVLKPQEAHMSRTTAV